MFFYRNKVQIQFYLGGLMVVINHTYRDGRVNVNLGSHDFIVIVQSVQLVIWSSDCLVKYEFLLCLEMLQIDWSLFPNLVLSHNSYYYHFSQHHYWVIQEEHSLTSISPQLMLQMTTPMMALLPEEDSSSTPASD